MGIEHPCKLRQLSRAAASTLHVKQTPRISAVSFSPCTSISTSTPTNGDRQQHRWLLDTSQMNMMCGQQGSLHESLQACSEMLLSTQREQNSGNSGNFRCLRTLTQWRTHLQLNFARLLWRNYLVLCCSWDVEVRFIPLLNKKLLGGFQNTQTSV